MADPQQNVALNRLKDGVAVKQFTTRQLANLMGKSEITLSRCCRWVL